MGITLRELTDKISVKGRLRNCPSFIKEGIKAAALYRGEPLVEE